jgi:hypothetical protein
MQLLAVDVALFGTWSRIHLFYNPCCPFSQAKFEHYFSFVGD